MKTIIRSIISSIGFLLLVHSSFAQRYDYVWKFGYRVLNPNFLQTQILDFNKDSLYFSLDPNPNINYNSSYALMCDSSGEVILQTSGCYMADENGDTLVNGDSLTLGQAFEVWCPYAMYGVWQYGFFLPAPGKTNQYYLINVAANNTINSLRYSLVDVPTKTVLEKNTPILTNQTIEIGGFMANKHANGRDWWIVSRVANGNKHFIMLLDDQGMHNMDTLNIGVSTFGSRHADMVFSPDGSTLAFSNPHNDLFLYDFDRCSGELSNPRHIEIQDTADIETGMLSSPLCFSADGHYLYKSNQLLCYQFDMWSDDIEASRQVIAEYDGTFSGFQNVLGGEMTVGPDGRIYNKPASGSAKNMHVILHPERGGTASEFRNNYYSLGDHGYAALPNIPHYLLGPIDGSPCDTLGIDNHPIANFRFQRLSGLQVDFTSVSWYEPEVWSWDFGDGSPLSSEVNPLHTFALPGTYTVCLTVSNQYGSDTHCKQVYVDNSLGTWAAEADLYWELWPNPTAGALYYDTGEGSEGNRLVVVDLSGRTVLTQVVGSRLGELALDGLPSGLYFVQVWGEGRLLGVRKVVRR